MSRADRQLRVDLRPTSNGNLIWVNGCRGQLRQHRGGIGPLHGRPTPTTAPGRAACPRPTGLDLPAQSGWRRPTLILPVRSTPTAGSRAPGVAAAALAADPDRWTFTGQGQAAWTIEGNSQYVVMGGEFPRVQPGRSAGAWPRAPRRSLRTGSAPGLHLGSPPSWSGPDRARSGSPDHRLGPITSASPTRCCAHDGDRHDGG